MPKSTSKTSRKAGASSTAVAEPEFVLKHRIAGAAFLLFFGALVLPWVLGAPGQNEASLDAQAANSDSGSNLLSENALQDALADEQVAVEEQVYISKITPLDAQGNRPDPAPDEAKSDAKEGSEPSSTPKSPQLSKSTRSESPELKTGTTPKAITPTKVAKAKPAESKAATSEKKITEPENSKPVIKQPSIEVGWVVQVGVFTDKRGANKVVADLRSKGFKPSTTIVDTNRGKATGTRIWLGPFAQRVEAAKAKSELTQKTGEAGFIRAYP